MITTTFEEKFEILVDLLPPHINNAESDSPEIFNIRFDWGSQEKLNEFICLPENKSKYPLIWLVEGKDKEDKVTGYISRDSKIIIATQTLGASRFNREIYKAEYKGILNPIKNNLIKALEASGISKIDNLYNVSRIQDYQWNNVNDENATGDVWMVIYLEAKITFDTRKCINTIKF
jgi:hypothetical protein